MSAPRLALTGSLLWVFTSPAAAQVPSVSRIFVSASAGAASATPEVRQALVRTIHAEPTTFDALLGSGSGPVFDAGGGARLWSRLWVGASFSMSGHSHGVDVSGRLPHPFQFGASREISGSQSGLRHEEEALHIAAEWRHGLSPRFDVSVFGGPTRFAVNQDVLESVRFSEVYPYDTATFEAAEVVRQSASTLTFNVGGSVTYRVTRTIGIAGTVRYAAASIDVTPPGGQTISVRAGGTQALAGVRAEF